MLYCSVDIETSGLDSENNQVLSIGAIIEDTEKKLSIKEIPKFNAIVLQREICGAPRAINMNREIIKLMGEYIEGDGEVKEYLKKFSGYRFCEPEEVIKEFFKFLWSNGYGDDSKYPAPISSSTKPITLNVAGKNFGTFDKLFLMKLPWWQKLIKVRSRIIDPAILCCDWGKDTMLPSLDECKVRKGIVGDVTHNAVEDAWDVIQILRKFY